MDEEMQALEKNNTWEMVDLPEGKETVVCKWVFTVKHRSDGSVERYKAHFVIKEYTQTYGINYHDSFFYIIIIIIMIASIVKMNTVTVLMSLVIHHG